MYVLPAGYAKRPRKPRTKPNQHHEASLQETVVAFLDRVLLPPATYTAIGHGVYFTKDREEAQRRGARLKRLGVKPGWPDLIILHNGRAHGIELKTKEGTLSDAQKAVHTAIVLARCTVTVCRSVDDVRDRLEVWGIPMLKVHLMPAERAVERRKLRERSSDDGTIDPTCDRPARPGDRVLADRGLRAAGDTDPGAVQGGDHRDSGADRDPMARE